MPLPGMAGPVRGPQARVPMSRSEYPGALLCMPTFQGAHMGVPLPGTARRRNLRGARAPGRSPRAPLGVFATIAQEHMSRGTGLGPAHESMDEVTKFLLPPQTKFKKLMCANRGEIAHRIFRASIELGLPTLAIYSGEDKDQPHRWKAEESYEVGAPDDTPVQCYLNKEEILKVAIEQGVDVIHPGYGFLSENSEFAQMCADHGVTFVGPLPETIKAMGDKTEARKLARECGVPIVPGTDQALSSVEEAKAFAVQAGFPVILKAAMGGGGRGMRVVFSEDQMEEFFTRASNEAKASFGDGRMFIEKYVEHPRHIEVQILADHYGNVVHLYERDCSVQRRHQKVVEVAPAFGLAEDIRQALFRDAVKLARHVNYRNAGTVEFMVDKHGKHFFLEVNPRVQVEHTITEEITGIDIVQSQVRIAGGASLADLGFATQEDVPPPNGFAIQCRVTCEDPDRNFQPDSGKILVYRSPGGPGIRLDGAVTQGMAITSHYDSLLVKVISSAKTYDQAIKKMRRALYEFQIRGVKTNIDFLVNVLKHPEFERGEAATSFIERHKELFNFSTSNAFQSSKLLLYLAEMVVNGPVHIKPDKVYPPKIIVNPPAVPKGAKEPPKGWRDLLVAEGPEAWAKAVRQHKGVLITDTTWRDAHQSLLATRVRTHDLVRSAPATAHYLAGAASLEAWGGATFDVALNFLKECPWRRLSQLRALVPNIPFQMLLRGSNAVGYTSYPDNVVDAFVAEAKKTGVDIFRVFDALNYIDNLKFGVDSVHRAGGFAEGAICYTGDLTDPKKTKYTLDYYLDLAQQLVEHGVHALAIKDMAGLLKPRAAEMLVSALRREFPDTVIHVHTHDTAGTGVATQLAAAQAGADIIDCCIDSMSGTTSQPSMGALVNLFAGSELDTGIGPLGLQELNTYWEQTRLLYSPFESDLRSPASDVYLNEIPGGQYTNLKYQATELGLSGTGRWEQIKKAYAEANRVLGDIVKVTPTSKVVGDLAQFMVQNNLTEKSVIDKASELSFPNSVVEYLQGYLGQPPGGFPEPFRSRVLKDKPRIEGRRGASMNPINIKSLEANLKSKYVGQKVTYRDCMSSVMYEKEFNQYMQWVLNYSKLTENLPTRHFLVPLEEDEEIEVQISKGNVIKIKYKAVSESQTNGTREVFFEVNGLPRVVEVVDRKSLESSSGAGARSAREKSDPANLGSVGAPMTSEVTEVRAKPGTRVKAGEPLVALSAMKMETVVGAPCSGIVQHVTVRPKDKVEAGDLVVLIKEDELDELDELAELGNGNGNGAAAEAAPANGTAGRNGALLEP